MFLALTHFWNNRRGTTAIITALCGPVVVGFLALAVDVGSWQVARLSLQGAADAAAYSAVVAYNNSVNNSVVRQAKGITAAYGYVDGQNGVTVSVNQPPTSGAHTSDVTAIEVIIQQAQKRYFSALFLSSNPTVTVRAVGSPGTTGSCVVALDTSAQAAFNVSGSGTVTLQNCDIHVNSNNSKALEVQGGSATLSTKDAYIVGNYCADSCSGGSSFVVSGTLQTGAAAITDPYAGRTAPTIVSCGSNPTNSGGGGYSGNYTSPSAPTTIYPGVYCGDIVAGGPLTLSPGVYVLKGGNFKVQGGSSSDPQLVNGACTSSSGKPYVNATGVTLYLGANGSSYGSVSASSCLSITAPSSGDTAGIAVWVDKNAPTNGKDAFSGGSKLAITGAIYAASNEVDYTGSATATTGCTQIVSRIINFSGSANLQHLCSGLGVSDPGGGGSAPALVE